MEEYSRHGKVGLSAQRSGMNRKTAAKYIVSGVLPSEAPSERTWRTRSDPFEKDWPRIVELLVAEPEIEAAIVMEQLIEENPERYQEGQLRSLQRRFKAWRATDGPSKRVFFPQVHRPGEAMQTDFTWGTELEVTIAGEAFPHLICHSVLPCSNWEWVSLCRSESLAAILRGLQAALIELGHVPKFHQTDNSTGATHHLPSGKRAFNEDYLTLVNHFGMKARTTGVGEKEQNGDVEASNGAFKRRVRQRLLLRGSRDFASVEAYESWLREVARRANRGRQVKLREELAVMAPLRAPRLLEYTEVTVRVTSWSTIRIKSNAYSVPSQLIGEHVRVRSFEDRLEVFYGGRRRLTMDRLVGTSRHRINYRDVIESLVRHPAAFERYRYREDLFPSEAFRRAYDTLRLELSERAADIEYLRILRYAAETMETEVEQALEILLEANVLPSADEVKSLVKLDKPEVPVIAIETVNLKGYDALLHTLGETGS